LFSRNSTNGTSVPPVNPVRFSSLFLLWVSMDFFLLADHYVSYHSQ
jgi:hypothetical protein